MLVSNGHSYSHSFSNSQKGYTKDEIEKIGNTLIYFAEKINDLSKTKALKLVYLLDELSVKEYGIPVLGLEYKIWQAGPVNVDIYTELSGEPQLLKEYLDVNFTPTGECYVSPKKKFTDDEFSDNELNLMDKVVSKFGSFTATKLVELCHRPNTLWYMIAKENGLLESFKEGLRNTTDFVIDLSDYIKSDLRKASIYEDYQEFVQFTKQLKAQN